MTITTNSGGEGDRAGWIDHDGGPNPAPGARVDVRFADEEVERDMSSEFWLCDGVDWWRHESLNPSQHIIAYRVVSPVAVEGKGSSAEGADTQPGSADRWADLAAKAERCTTGDPWYTDEDLKGRQSFGQFLPQDRAFIAAANPAAVLALIAAARGVSGGDEGSQSRSEPDTSHRSAEGAVVVPETLVRFLLGEGDLDGVWFGDDVVSPRGRRLPFWWRTPLRACLAEPDTSTRTTGEAGQ